VTAAGKKGRALENDKRNKKQRVKNSSKDKKIHKK
jgi:hypothetical protein